MALKVFGFGFAAALGRIVWAFFCGPVENGWDFFWLGLLGGIVGWTWKRFGSSWAIGLAFGEVLWVGYEMLQHEGLKSPVLLLVFLPIGLGVTWLFTSLLPKPSESSPA